MITILIAVLAVIIALTAATLLLGVPLALRAIGTFGREDEAPAAPRRRERGTHERDRSDRGFDWRGEGLKGRLHARNEKRIAGAAPLLAAPLAVEVAHDGLAGQPGKNGSDGAGLTGPLASESPPSPALPEEPEDCLYYDMVDDWIGDLGPAERALPEPVRLPRPQPGRFPPAAALRVQTLIASALIAAVKPRVTVYPDWPTGNFPSVVAELGASA
jgi:hypothetical protein